MNAEPETRLRRAWEAVRARAEAGAARYRHAAQQIAVERVSRAVELRGF